MSTVDPITLAVVRGAVRGVLNSDSYLQRIERYTDACELSLRYVHKLFSATPYSVNEWIRLKRLEAVNRQLKDPQCHLLIGELVSLGG